jgi:hypothetical protein
MEALKIVSVKARREPDRGRLAFPDLTIRKAIRCAVTGVNQQTETSIPALVGPRQRHFSPTCRSQTFSLFWYSFTLFLAISICFALLHSLFSSSIVEGN